MNETMKMIKGAKTASSTLLSVEERRNAEILEKVSDCLMQEKEAILAANAEDLKKMDPSDPDYDRLRLTPERLAGIASDMKDVAHLPTAINRVVWEKSRPNGMTIRKVTAPFGVIGVIYEARPNVTADVFALCFRSGSAAVLKGGSDADLSSRAIVGVIRRVLREENLPEDLCVLLPAGRESASVMMGAVGLIDVIIPRGGRGLIDYVRDHSRVPVIETGAGVCHTYIHSSADLVKSRDIILNAKTRRVSVCNALDCVLVDKERLTDLGAVLAPLAEKDVVIYADEKAKEALCGVYPDELLMDAVPESYGTEFRDYKMAVKTVEGIDEALAHISAYGSHHSECIVSEDKEAIGRFQREVDASCVYANVSTAFTDGGQFGFGAEIGISTQKLHARGPMALEELVTYKYLIDGNGQVR